MDPDQVWDTLQALVGQWEGEGEGWFPTIDDFTYRESLTIEDGSPNRQLRFNQTSWRRTDDGERESHTESGFIGVSDDGLVEMTAAEALDRVEVLAGRLGMDDGRHVLELATTSVAGDERVLRSWRRLTFTRDVIDYSMGMATTAVPDGGPHLAGRLTRRS